MRAGGFDPDGRLRDMELDGVVAEVIYPTFGLFIDMIPAADLQMACARVYNDWLAESFLHRPDVFVPAAVVPVRDVASAAAELGRVAALGFKAAMIPTSAPEGVRYNQPAYDPLWQIASDAHMPLSLHTGTGALPQFERGPGGAVINYAKVGLLSAETLCYFAASGSARALPRPAPRVRRDRRRMVRVLLRAHGRGVRGARAVGEPEARRTAVGIGEAAVPRDARRRPRAAAHPRDHGGRAADVGQRLPASRRDVPRVAAGGRAHLRRCSRSGACWRSSAGTPLACTTSICRSEPAGARS